MIIPRECSKVNTAKSISVLSSPTALNFINWITPAFSFLPAIWIALSLVRQFSVTVAPGFPHDIQRSVFRFIVNPSDILPYYSEQHQHNAVKQQIDADDRSPAGNRPGCKQLLEQYKKQIKEAGEGQEKAYV
ncbi:hypothetical protein D3C73_1288950 [compost metagenome]